MHEVRVVSRHGGLRRDREVSACVITYDGQPTHSVSIMEFARGFVAHETQYFADRFPAAAWHRAVIGRRVGARGPTDLRFGFAEP